MRFRKAFKPFSPVPAPGTAKPGNEAVAGAELAIIDPHQSGRPGPADIDKTEQVTLFGQAQILESRLRGRPRRTGAGSAEKPKPGPSTSRQAQS